MEKVEEIKHFVRLSLVVRWPFPEQEAYVAALVKHRAEGEFYPLDIEIEKAEGFRMLNGKVLKRR